MSKFGSSKHKVSQQGSLDSLCGVYCVVNFFARRLSLSSGKDHKKRQNLLRLAVEAVSCHSVFDAELLIKGYRQASLRAAFNAIEERYQLGVEAKTISSYAKLAGSKSIFDLLGNLGEGEAALIRLRNPDHWILGYDVAQKHFWADDSFYDEKRRKIQRSIVDDRRIELKNGLVFINA